ncbi:MAG: 50S ribosomal protein L23 [Candidatus Omnitrophica bacterium]|nr:50S ribosomal protein L23 [Candidatus Omnitrophota bacterium]
MKLDIYDVLLYMLQTEKSTRDNRANKYTFVVSPYANKVQIREAIEKIYKVKVKKVNTIIVPGKIRRIGRFWGRKPDWKKAVVTLKEGEKIEIG